MRFYKNVKRPCIGEHRVFRQFLWLPLTIAGETRWLEFADVEYRYACLFRYGDIWVPVRFISP